MSVPHASAAMSIWVDASLADQLDAAPHLLVSRLSNRATGPQEAGLITFIQNDSAWPGVATSTRMLLVPIASTNSFAVPRASGLVP